MEKNNDNVITCSKDIRENCITAYIESQYMSLDRLRDMLATYQLPILSEEETIFIKRMRAKKWGERWR